MLVTPRLTPGFNDGVDDFAYGPWSMRVRRETTLPLETQTISKVAEIIADFSLDTSHSPTQLMI